MLAATVQCIAAVALVHRATAFRLGHVRVASSSRAARPAISMAADDAHDEQTRFREHQKGAAKLEAAVEARSIVAYSPGYAIISTIGKAGDGYPNGGLVGFAPDADGLPIFFLSSLSVHTRDLLACSKASLTVTASGFDNMDAGRVNLVGDVVQLTAEAEIAAAREAYLKKHADAFWIDFGDFSVSPGRVGVGMLGRGRGAFVDKRAGAVWIDLSAYSVGGGLCGRSGREAWLPWLGLARSGRGGCCARALAWLAVGVPCRASSQAV
jgi:hypothetical protein